MMPPQLVAKIEFEPSVTPQDVEHALAVSDGFALPETVVDYVRSQRSSEAAEHGCWTLFGILCLVPLVGYSVIWGLRGGASLSVATAIMAFAVVALILVISAIWYFWIAERTARRKPLDPLEVEAQSTPEAAARTFAQATITQYRGCMQGYYPPSSLPKWEIALLVIAPTTRVMGTPNPAAELCQAWTEWVDKTFSPAVLNALRGFLESECPAGTSAHIIDRALSQVSAAFDNDRIAAVVTEICSRYALSGTSASAHAPEVRTTLKNVTVRIGTRWYVVGAEPSGEFRAVTGSEQALP